MSADGIETIELQMTILGRWNTSFAADKRWGSLERAAYLLLRQLQNHGPIGVKALAEELQADISTVSRQAAVLDKKGYAVKVPDTNDRRAYFYQITEFGRRELTQFQQKRLELISGLLSDWSDEERETFGNLLMKFNESLKGKM
ncbi:MarR family winged helix-turn-helix transcriptional regulator [Peribacillus deserti]|uniref:MarR family transcriptional regulator n=1 Tax=Peribacillus deserti TaxID=673318 RepID=A0A2N5M5E6_9BACI|nr:MarR family transcriptional regulator [Peribacillus deserti]PLT29580.1 MarR family transcriptional regulator [Peribacillus deserti]